MLDVSGALFRVPVAPLGSAHPRSRNSSTTNSAAVTAGTNTSRRIESLVPTVPAIRVTDYYLLELYERVPREKDASRLSQCDLVFPNVEMRLTIGTVRAESLQGIRGRKRRGARPRGHRAALPRPVVFRIRGWRATNVR